MPLYEYQCGHCGRFELIKKFSDPALVSCPTCGREVTKLLSAPAIQFKGSGWYVTDYARKSGGDGASKGEASSSATSKDGSSVERAGSKETGSPPSASSKDSSSASGSGSSK